MTDVSLSRDQLEELFDLYWNSEIPTQELAEAYQLPTQQVHRFIEPLIDEKWCCPNCGGKTGYRSRTARQSGSMFCVQECGHIDNTYTCPCPRCHEIRKQEAARRAEQIRKEREERAAEEWQAFHTLVEKTGNDVYLKEVLAKTQRKDRELLLAYFDFVENGCKRDADDSTGWLTLSRMAGIISHKKYLRRLMKLHLLLQRPDSVVLLHPCLEREWIELPKAVRQISQGTRFKVFERDNYTCQYCGRQAPDVELVIDHLLPVAKGGTDDFHNLITACDDCNAGKSAMLINKVRGVDREEWRDRMRAARAAVIEDRRDRANEVYAKWESLFRRTSTWEEANLERWIEYYDTDMILRAFDATARKGRELQGDDARVRYTAAVLGRMARGEDDLERAAYSASLAARSATDKQKKYILSLLKSAGIELGDVYDKVDVDDLTMLDAQNIINELRGGD